MDNKKAHQSSIPELDDEERAHIAEMFFKEVVPRLKRLDARLGTISCEFVGEHYKNWNIRFHSVGSDFDIVDFEYDEDAVGIDLDL